MKERLFKNWTWVRVFYLVIGLLLIAQSIYEQMWFGIFFGGYFASMGLFAFGCAGGACISNQCVAEDKAEFDKKKD
ncbi:MAG: hypothetical protein H6605_00295 [Flavobacteriales bacterium]|nr:hypothetical protein [Flavobacteriales bacterium]